MDKLDTLTLFVRIVRTGLARAAAGIWVSGRWRPRPLRRWRPVSGGCCSGTTAARTTDGGGLAVLSALRGYSGGPRGGQPQRRGSIAGIIRVDVAGNLARTPLLPALPQFLARYLCHGRPQIGESERDIDLVREGSTASFVAAISRPAR